MDPTAFDRIPRIPSGFSWAKKSLQHLITDKRGEGEDELLPPPSSSEDETDEKDDKKDEGNRSLPSILLERMLANRKPTTPRASAAHSPRGSVDLARPHNSLASPRARNCASLDLTPRAASTSDACQRDLSPLHNAAMSMHRQRGAAPASPGVPSNLKFPLPPESPRPETSSTNSSPRVSRLRQRTADQRPQRRRFSIDLSYIDTAAESVTRLMVKDPPPAPGHLSFRRSMDDRGPTHTHTHQTPTTHPPDMPHAPGHLSFRRSMDDRGPPHTHQTPQTCARTPRDASMAHTQPHPNFLSPRPHIATTNPTETTSANNATNSNNNTSITDTTTHTKSSCSKNNEDLPPGLPLHPPAPPTTLRRSAEHAHSGHCSSTALHANPHSDFNTSSSRAAPLRRSAEHVPSGHCSSGALHVNPHSDFSFSSSRPAPTASTADAERARAFASVLTSAPAHLHPSTASQPPTCPSLPTPLAGGVATHSTPHLSSRVRGNASASSDNAGSGVQGCVQPRMRSFDASSVSVQHGGCAPSVLPHAASSSSSSSAAHSSRLNASSTCAGKGQPLVHSLHSSSTPPTHSMLPAIRNTPCGNSSTHRLGLPHVPSLNLGALSARKKHEEGELREEGSSGTGSQRLGTPHAGHVPSLNLGALSAHGKQEEGSMSARGATPMDAGGPQSSTQNPSTLGRTSGTFFRTPRV